MNVGEEDRNEANPTNKGRDGGYLYGTQKEEMGGNIGTEGAIRCFKNTRMLFGCTHSECAERKGAREESIRRGTRGIVVECKKDM